MLITTRKFQKAKLYSIDGSPVECSSEARICPLIHTSAGPCRLSNVKAKIIEYFYTYIRPGTVCAGEIVLGNPLLKAAGFDVEECFVNRIDELSYLDLGALIFDETPRRLGKLGARLHGS